MAQRSLADFAERVSALSPGQLVVFSRLALAAFALIAIYMDPTQPTRLVPAAYGLLVLYVLYSAALAFTLERISSWPGVAAAVRHGIDILVIAILIYLTEGPTSPFFVFFTFVLLAAAVSWGWPAVTLTAILLIFLLLITAWLGPMAEAGDVELNRLIMRAAYLLVISVMIGYFGSYRLRSRDRLAELAAWPLQAGAAELEPALVSAIRPAASVLRAGRIFIFWDDRGKFRQSAQWDGTLLTMNNQTNPTTTSLVAAGLSGIAFLVDRPLDQRAITRSGPRLVSEPLVSDEVGALCRGARFSTAPFEVGRYRGRVFIIEPRPFGEEALWLTEIIGARIGIELENFSLLKDLSEAAAARERSRIARDLHDGILQDLTAVRLTFGNIARSLPTDARAPIEEMRELLARQQQRIRELLAATNASGSNLPNRFTFAERFNQLVEQLSEQWSCAIRINFDPSRVTVPWELVTHIGLMISEAVANAVRHGRANRISISIEGEEGLRIVVSDNGTGLDQSAPGGHLDAPTSLIGRVHELGGACTLANAPGGAKLSIDLPLQ